MVGRGGQVLGQALEGGDAVDVVGVDDGERAVADEAPGAQDGVDGSEGDGLEGVDTGTDGRPAPTDVVA